MPRKREQQTKLQKFSARPNEQMLRVHAVGELEGFDWEITGLCFSPDGVLLATGAEGAEEADTGAVRIWDVAQRTVLHTLSDLSAPVTDLSFSSDGTLLAIALSDGNVWVCTSEGELVDTLSNTVAGTRVTGAISVAFMPNDLLATVDESGIVHIWDVCPARLLQTFAGAPIPLPRATCRKQRPTVAWTLRGSKVCVRIRPT